MVGIEHIPSLTALAETNIRKDGLGKAIEEQRIVLVTGDGRLGAFFPSSFTPSSLSFHNPPPHYAHRDPIYFLSIWFVRVR